MKTKKTHEKKQLRLRWVFVFLTLATLLLLTSFLYFSSKQQTVLTPSSPPEEISIMNKREKKRVDNWIEKNNLNEFGDPKGTAYIGGTPLFNEATGQYTDRYLHILKRHPDRPWNR